MGVRKCTGLILILYLAALATPAAAAPITFGFSTTVIDVFPAGSFVFPPAFGSLGPQVGADFSGQFTIETDTPDQSPDNTSWGSYDGAVTTFSFNIAGVYLSFDQSNPEADSVVNPIVGGGTFGHLGVLMQNDYGGNRYSLSLQRLATVSTDSIFELETAVGTEFGFSFMITPVGGTGSTYGAVAGTRALLQHAAPLPEPTEFSALVVTVLAFAARRVIG